MVNLILTTFDWVPKTSRGYVREISGKPALISLDKKAISLERHTNRPPEPRNVAYAIAQI